jgi:hypothetical protein
LEESYFGAVLRGLAVFVATRLVVAFFPTFVDFLEVLPAIVSTPGLYRSRKGREF